MSAADKEVSRDVLFKNTLPEAQIKITINSQAMEGSSADLPKEQTPKFTGFNSQKHLD